MERPCLISIKNIPFSTRKYIYSLYNFAFSVEIHITKLTEKFHVYGPLTPGGRQDVSYHNTRTQSQTMPIVQNVAHTVLLFWDVSMSFYKISWLCAPSQMNIALGLKVAKSAWMFDVEHLVHAECSIEHPSGPEFSIEHSDKSENSMIQNYTFLTHSIKIILKLFLTVIF